LKVFFIMIIPIIISYAEIHYHLKGLFPLYYKRLPEILADIPARLITGTYKDLPILIIIKDSHLFPIELEEITVTAENNSIEVKETFIFHRTIKNPYFSDIIRFNIEKFKIDELLLINVTFHIKRKDKRYTFINDSYNLPQTPFTCYLSSKALPYPKNWYAGEPHYHSSYTEDQVEFGADIPATIEMAKVMGLSWFFVTDHSYDLDDSLTDFTRNDPDLPKWKRMRSEISDLPDTDVNVIPGEEISIGNHYGRNVHLLAINHDDFIEGCGDSAEVWFRNKPSTFISQIADLHNNNNLFIAAHPWEKVPFLQRLTLRRDRWHNEDLESGKIKFIQLINGSDKKNLEQNKKRWIDLLLKGKKIYIVAGNDAHGNFNIMRQIKIPFVKLFSSRSQIFGKYHTVFHFNSNDPIKGLKKGRIIVSNGPFLEFSLIREDKRYQIGSNITTGKVKMEYSLSTTPEFGPVESIRLIIGDCTTFEETIIYQPENHLEFELPGSGYIRMEMDTKSAGIVITNPVWICNS